MPTATTTLSATAKIHIPQLAVETEAARALLEGRVATLESGTTLRTAATAITAGTTRTQAGATVLAAGLNRVDTSTAPAAGATLGDGVVLPAGTAAAQVYVHNNTANNIQVYGNGTDTINGLAATVGVPVPPGDLACFMCPAVGGWVFEAGVGTSKGLPVLLSAASITAGTTRTQAGATVIAADINRVDTSTAPAAGSTIGDGVVLPAGVAGLDIVVANNTANPIQVYGNGTDTINGVAAATGVALPPGDVATFVCAAAGGWLYDAGMGSSGPLPVELAADSVSAAGANQAAATQLVAAFNRILTATANQGVKLPASAAGLDVIVENHSGVSIIVYGAGTDQIDDVATATGIQQMDSSVVLYTCYAPGKWYSNGAATGYAKNPTNGVVLETVQYADALTAAGTTQATGLQLTAAINTISTAAAGTGVNLPASSPGLSICVQNNGANPLMVYPVQGGSETINGIAAATGISLHPGTVGVFNCTAAGAWTVEPASPVQAILNVVTSVDANISLTAAQITGAVSAVDTQVSGGVAFTAGRNLTLPTVAQLTAALHAPTIGTSFRLRITNAQGGAFAGTVTTNTGWTLTGTLTIAQNTWREFVVTLTSLTTATAKSVATGTYS